MQGEAQEDVEKMIRGNPVEKAGIIHCYFGTPKMAKRFIEMGYYLGIKGPITRDESVQEKVRITPIDKIVIETDRLVYQQSHLQNMQEIIHGT